MRRSLALALVLALAVPATAAAQGLKLRGPRVVATGTAFELRGTAPAGVRMQIEIGVNGRWRPLAGARARANGRFERRVRPKRPRRRYVLRMRAPDGTLSNRVVVRSRHVTLASVGDINLGNGPGLLIASMGVRYPWTGVASALRRADVAFGNLECAVSNRGAPVPKQFTFRGRPAALRAMARYAGFDVLNLANNHVGDYGTAAMLDTIDFTRRYGMTPVGAGRSLAAALQPRVVERLGLRIAFVGFSDILPAWFWAGPGRPGTAQATPDNIRRAVRAADRVADVVVATFHWGIERATVEDGRQRGFAAAALAAGADAVIGAHPHVLQPIRRSGRWVIAYSLGNFVFGAASPGTTATGILDLRLSARGVEGMRFRRARIAGTRPHLIR